jgi:hypothetical protein
VSTFEDIVETIPQKISVIADVVLGISWMLAKYVLGL